MATAQSGIPSSIEPGQYVSGSPAIPHQDWLKASAAYRQLPALRKRVAELEHRIAELEEKLEECRSRLNPSLRGIPSPARGRCRVPAVRCVRGRRHGGRRPCERSTAGSPARRQHFAGQGRVPAADQLPSDRQHAERRRSPIHLGRALGRQRRRARLPLRPPRRSSATTRPWSAASGRTSTSTRASTSSRRRRPGVIGEHEFALVFHHVSRHLTDRLKPKPTAWNVLEARYLRNFNFRRHDGRAGRAPAGNVVTHVDVDYTWNLNFDVAVRRPVKPRLDVYARGLGEAFGVDPAIKGRTQAQHSGRFEGGVRFNARERRARVVCRRRAPHGCGFTRLPAAHVGHHGIPPGEQVSWGIMPERTPR